ncbi:MAG: family 16 glycosylhydrolase [Bacteroidales bacterium]|nr:family 16 glycosylhydrolase [Bacteroidales bacterium]
MKKLLVFCLVIFTLLPYVRGQRNSFLPGQPWPDNNGAHINAHGGGIIYHKGKYYWFGEHKGERSNSAWVGITCYSSKDLYNWKNEGVALPVEQNDSTSDIIAGCVMERPKVIYNEKTQKFILFFHLELKGRGYRAARVGIAISDKITGPYNYIRSFRPNAGKWPENMTEEQRNSEIRPESFEKEWTPEWMQAVKDGLFVRRDFQGGQMSRDMTLFVDDDKKAYHIYSSEENFTLHIAELSDDYLTHTGKYVRMAPAGHNEAPAIFKKDGKYFMITSGCTGWDPNAARLHVATNIMGPWKEYPNPCKGDGAELTFHSQSTYILPVSGKKDAFIFMADRWTPKKPIEGGYIWLPVLFNDGLPVLKWADEWDLDIFEDVRPVAEVPKDVRGWKLVWNDEFDNNGQPDPGVWSHENGFVRNEEFQWYQPDNANCADGLLTICGKKDQIKNPDYSPGNNDWRKKRPYAQYSSSCIRTTGKKEFLYGRFEIRARIPVASGAWPAIWTLGNSMEWPSNGEIDIMEYYQVKGVPHILANTAWGTEKRYHAAWNTCMFPFTEFTDKDPYWTEKFHIWRMDWDKNAIRIYLDDRLLNETLLKDTFNGSLGEHKNPFRQPHYILLNLAIGGINGGIPDDETFPLKYEIDYVRVYQKK